MKKAFLVSALMLLPGYAAAVEVGKVISSTPVTRDVGVAQKQCAPDASSRDACRSVTNFEKQTVGYKVVYEYAGKRYTTQLAQDPGATVSLQITPTAASQPAARATAAPTAAAREPIYEDRWDADRDRPYRVVRSTEGWDADRDRGYSTTIYTAPRYVEQVYVEPSYYAPRTYYAPANYGYNHGYDYRYASAPLWPLLGLSIGLASSYRGHGYYGGHYGHRSHHHGGHRGYHHGR